MIGVERLSVAIGGRPVLDDVSLALPPGRITGLVGESGSGKSMTALAIMGLLPDGARAAGRVDLDGRDLLVLDDRRMSDLRGRRIGMIFQEPMTALNPVASIGTQIAEMFVIHRGMDWTTARQRAVEALDSVQVPSPE